MRKNKKLKKLTDYLLEKYGSTKIFLTDYWDADNSAIGLTDVTKQYTVYISNYGFDDNVYFISLEYPPTSDEFPYTPGENFEKLNAEEVEKILVKHLKIF